MYAVGGNISEVCSTGLALEARSVRSTGGFPLTYLAFSHILGRASHPWSKLMETRARHEGDPLEGVPLARTSTCPYYPSLPRRSSIWRGTVIHMRHFFLDMDISVME